MGISMKKEKNMRATRGGTGDDGQCRLRQYRILAKEIADDRKRLAQLSALYTPEHMKSGLLMAVSENPAGLPLGMQAISELDRYRSSINENYRRCARLLGELQDYINSIDDSEMRQIFKMHYINGWTWQKIAFRIDSTDESYPRKKHAKYLKKHPFLPSLGSETDAWEINDDENSDF